MHERERHRIIVSAVGSRPVATVGELVELTGSSEATVRRDIAALDLEGRVRRVRGGAESPTPRAQPGLVGRPFSVNATLNVAAKRAIAREAVALCEDGDDVIVNGGTTTFEMVHGLAARRLQVFTNSLPIAEHLLAHSRNPVHLAGGTVYREQSIVLSPFDDDFSQHFHAVRMFMGADGVGRLGLTESDPLVAQAERRLLGRADELVVLADSSKFRRRASSLVFCALEDVDVLVTDEGVDDASVATLEAAEVRVVVAEARTDAARAAGDAS